MTGTQKSPPFRLAYVPGVTPAKWVRTWTERLPDVPLDLVAVEPGDAERAVRDGDADAALLRLPVDRALLSAIPLYTESTVVVVPKDHEVTAAEQVSLHDLDDYIVLHPLDDTLAWPELPGKPAVERPATTADAIELVAAGIGVLLVPQSLARLHHRRDLTYRPMTEPAPEGADEGTRGGTEGGTDEAAAETPAPQSTVALSWLEGQTTDLVEEFIGIVRGRTVNSSRGRTPAPAAAPAKPQQQTSKQARGAKPAAGKRQPPKPARQARPAKPKRRK